MEVQCPPLGRQRHLIVHPANPTVLIGSLLNCHHRRAGPSNRPAKPKWTCYTKGIVSETAWGEERNTGEMHRPAACT